eukprot:CCRYP_018373-RD/>CCRYP_018373-RD protein AED:0.48 eAED:0.93 QI:0/0/0/1/0/0/2/0/66
MSSLSFQSFTNRAHFSPTSQPAAAATASSARFRSRSLGNTILPILKIPASGMEYFMPFVAHNCIDI